MISFALSVELQTIVNGLSSLDKLSSKLAQIDNIANAINKTFLGMGASLKGAAAGLEPLTVEMGHLAAASKTAFGSMKVPSMTTAISQTERLARSYERIGRANTTLANEPKASRWMSGGMGTFGKVFAAAEVGKFVWDANTSMATQMMQMRMQGTDEKTIKQARDASSFTAHTVAGTTEADAMMLNRKLANVIGNENMSPQLLQTLATDIKAISTYTGESVESATKYLVRGIEARGQLAPGEKFSADAAMKEANAFTRVVIATGGDAEAKDIMHIMQRSSEWNGMIKQNPNEAYGFIGALATNFGPRAGNYLNQVQREFLGGRLALTSGGRTAAMEAGLFNVGKQTALIDPPGPGRKAKVVPQMQDAINIDVSQGIVKGVDSFYGNLKAGRAARGLDTSEIGMKKTLDTMFNTYTAQLISWMESAQGKAQINREIGNTGKALGPEELRKLMDINPGLALESLVDAAKDLSVEMINLTNVVHILRGATEFIRNIADFFKDNQWAGSLVSGSLAVGATLWGLSKVLGKLGLGGPLGGKAGLGGLGCCEPGVGGAANKGAAAAEGAAGGAAANAAKKTLASTITDFLFGSGATGALGESVAAGALSTPMAGAALGGAYTAYQTGSASASDMEKAQALGLHTENVDPATGLPSSYGDKNRQGIQHDELEKMYSAFANPDLSTSDLMPLDTGRSVSPAQTAPTSAPSEKSQRKILQTGPFVPKTVYQVPGGPEIYDNRWQSPAVPGMTPLPNGAVPLPMQGSAGLSPLPANAISLTQQGSGVKPNDMVINDLYAKSIILDKSFGAGGGSGGGSYGGDIIKANYPGASDGSSPTGDSSVGGPPSIASTGGSPQTAYPPSVPGAEPDSAKAMGFNPAQWDATKSAIAKIEHARYDQMGGSNNRFAGKYQMGGDEIAETARHLHIPTPSRNEFLHNPQMQEQFMAQYTKDHYDYLMKNPKFAAMSKEKQAEVLAYAHNQGAGGANKYLNTGMVGHDANGTAGTAYSNAVDGMWPSQTAVAPPPPDTSSMRERPVNRGVSDVPNQQLNLTHHSHHYMDGDEISTHIIRTAFDFSPAASSGITSFDYRAGAIAPGMSVRA